MSRRRTWTLGIFGLLLPVALAVTGYAISSWGDAPANSSPGVQIVNQKINEDSGKSGELMESPRPDDHGDRCLEPEHRTDPSCTSGSSGSGSGVSGTDDSGGGGSGKDGSSSGDSGSGSSGKDSSGSSGSGSGPSPSSTPTSDDSSHSGEGGG